MTLETAKDSLSSFVDGEYAAISPTFPSLLIAVNTATTVDMLDGANVKLFIIDGNMKNLPYNLSGIMEQNATSLAEALGTTGTGITTNYTSCTQVMSSEKYF